MLKVKLKYLLFAVLVIVAAIYYFSNTKGTLKLRKTSFGVESIDEITEIRISKNNTLLHLHKEVGKWKVNNKYQVKERTIISFLTILNRENSNN